MAKNSLEVRKSINFRPQSTLPIDAEEGDVYRDSITDKLKHYKFGEWREFNVLSRLITYIDFTQTTLPPTTATLIDGQTIVTGDLVVFGDLTTNSQKIYEADVDGGGNIDWTARPLFDEGENPLKGESFRVANGDTGTLKQFCWDGTDWKDDGAGIIGDPEDSDYTDGLFIDFTPETRTGVAVDRFNEVLKELCPKPAPTLTNKSFTTGGVSSKLSFGISNEISLYEKVGVAAGGPALDINETFPVSGRRRGAFGLASKSGNLADSTVADPDGSYPAKSFGNADKGSLVLWINGTQRHTVDLSTFGSGVTTTDGSGFNLLAATSVKFPNGNPLDLFKYRTGTWTASTTHQRLGWNYIRVNHFFDGVDHWTDYFEWVVDTENTALSASGGSLHTLSMTGSRYLSGVQYHTGGSAQYNATISNAYRNIFSSSASAISFTGTGGTIASLAIPDMTTESDDITLTNEAFTINATRLLDASIVASVNCQHPLKPNLSGGASASITRLLMDNVTTDSTAVREQFCVETIRLQSTGNAGVNDYDAQADITTGAWDSTKVITAAGDDGYKEGLLYYSGTARYPTQGASSGNFAGITNGPVGNPDYSALTGDRVFYIKLQNNSGATKSDFRVTLQGSTTTFNSKATGPSGNAVTLEMKFPDGSIGAGTGWMDCYADFATGQWADGDGCRNATNGAGRALATNWGITIGTKSIAAAEFVILRLTAASGWTGNISDIQLTWL